MIIKSVSVEWRMCVGRSERVFSNNSRRASFFCVIFNLFSCWRNVKEKLHENISITIDQHSIKPPQKKSATECCVRRG